MKRVAVMQPYFLPYIGYFQLIGAVDEFIVYDDIQYTKKGWINRNRYLCEGRDRLFSLPLQAGSSLADVRERRLAAGFDREALLNRLREAYRQAPCFEETFPLVESVVRHDEANLFAYLLHSIRAVGSHLGIATPLTVSSTLGTDRALAGADRVIALCRRAGADTYINPIGGRELYAADAFARHGLALRFLRSGEVRYPQFGDGFVPALSIVDVLMFNGREATRRLVDGAYELLER